MAKILITGVTGFLGSSLAQGLIDEHVIMATRRASSSLALCSDFQKRLTWIYTDDERWITEAIEFGPEVIIHSAWSGVDSGDRDDESIQAENIGLLELLLNIAVTARAKKIIGFGSQAEYGNFSGVVGEEHPLEPLSAYGRAKVRSSLVLREFCKASGIEWYWLRLFSFFGKGQGERWLIPSAIEHMLAGREMALTGGMQKCAYFYAGDLGKLIGKLLQSGDVSDIYNVSGVISMTVRDLLETIRDQVRPSYELKFGTLPYRNDQTMHMAGDFSRFIGRFGPIELTPLEQALEKTIHYYEQLYKSRDE